MFSLAVQYILRDFTLPHFVYMDDVFVKVPNNFNCDDVLREMREKFAVHHLALNMSKCALITPRSLCVRSDFVSVASEGNILGAHVSDGIEVRTMVSKLSDEIALIERCVDMQSRWLLFRHIDSEVTIYFACHQAFDHCGGNA